MSGSRAVRIPRSRAPARPAVSPVGWTGDRRENRAGTQRAVRTTVLYVVAVLALTLMLTALDLSSSEGGRPAVLQGLELFLLIAALLIVGSSVFALSPAPRYLEVGADRIVVVGRWGGRRELGPFDSLAPRVRKHLPAGFLSSDAVDMVEVTDAAGRRHTYQVDVGFFDPRPPA
jgi:hypothetical protein